MAQESSAPALTVIGEIASGGMGSVELARMEDASGESLVAVKRMHPEHARDAEFVRMFRDEIWLMGALRHPNLVGLVGWGEDEGGPYLVMEYVDGVALARVAGNGRRALDPIPERLVAYVAARSAEGLDAAHRLADSNGRPLEIVHRDVTPSNVLIGFDGTVRVTDFGIAKAAGKSSHTRTGIIKGKIAYMSPEYALRRPVDGRADLYSLGVVMYELLSNELPFEARTDFDLLKKVAYAQAPTVASVAPDVDPGLGKIIDRLLQKDPALRQTSGAELALELFAWLERTGHDLGVLRGELAVFAEKHCGEKHKRLKRLLDDDADTVPDDGSGPKRPRLIALATRTFTLFEPTLASEGSQRSAAAGHAQPDLQRASRPDTQRLSRPDEERPRTRKVAVSDFPPAGPAAVVNVPPSSQPVSGPSSVGSGAVRVSAAPIQQLHSSDGRASVPPTDPRASSPALDARLSTPDLRASVPPAAGLTPIAATRAIRRHSSAVMGGVLAGSLVALLLVVVTVVVASRRGDRDDAVVAEQPPPGSPGEALPTAAPPPSAAPPEPPASVAPVASSAAQKPPKPSATGKSPRPPIRVWKPPSTKGKQPCTPTSFDYPACLSR